MGLIDLKTDLKSLRYGKDTIGGGYSGQPYIQTPIPDSFNTLGPREDFILRGGVNAIGDTVTDIKRLTKMFIDTKSPNGLIFFAKQNLLSRTAVRTQTSGILNEGVYTPLSTLAQAGVVNIGGHLNKQGLNPFAETGAYSNNNNLYSVKVKSSQPTDLNRLVTIYNSINKNETVSNFGFTKGTTINPNGLASGKASPVLLNYIGGPGSALGVGKTNIAYSSFRTGKNNPQSVNSGSFFYGTNGINYKSVNIDNKQVGGLQVEAGDGTKPWIKGGIFFDAGGNFYNDELPSFNVNSPQSSSLSNIPYGSLTWTPKQNISASVTANGQFSRYNPLLNGISEVNSIYDLTFGVFTIEQQKRGFDGNPLWYNNVYKSGSLEINTEAVGPNTWTPKADTEKYNPISGKNISNIYSIRANIKLFPSDYFNEITGQKLKSNSVYNTNITPEGPEYLTPFEEPPGPNTPSNQGASSIYANGAITYNQEDLIVSNPSRYSPSIKEDFRKILRRKIANENVAQGYEQTGNIVPLDYIDYSGNNIGVKNLLGNPGQNRQNKDYSDFSKGIRNKDGTTYKALDLINAEAVGEDLSNDDLVQFRIQSLFGGSTLVFRAFLGGISDNYSATLNTQQYVGRGENFYTYSGQTRKISLSWTVAALSREELLPMYKRLSYLAGMTAPKYVDGFMQGPLVNLTVGGYIYNLPGYIEGFSLEMAEDSTWEIAMKPNVNNMGQLEKDNTISQLTHVIKVSGFNFTPIPNYLPEVGARFISIVAPNGTPL